MWYRVTWKIFVLREGWYARSPLVIVFISRWYGFSVLIHWSHMFCPIFHIVGSLTLKTSLVSWIWWLTEKKNKICDRMNYFSHIFLWLTASLLHWAHTFLRTDWFSLFIVKDNVFSVYGEAWSQPPSSVQGMTGSWLWGLSASWVIQALL